MGTDHRSRREDSLPGGRSVFRNTGLPSSRDPGRPHGSSAEALPLADGVGLRNRFVLEQGRRLVAVETKYTGATRYAETRNLRTFLDDYPETAAGVPVYDGREIVRLHEKVVAVPWSALG